MIPDEKGVPQSRIYPVNIISVSVAPRSINSQTSDCSKQSVSHVGNIIHISRKSVEDWLKAEQLDSETE